MTGQQPYKAISKEITSDEDLIMQPVEQYMNEMRARDILREEQIQRDSLLTKKFKTGAQLRQELFGDEEIELDEVRIPKKKHYTWPLPPLIQLIVDLFRATWKV